MPRTPLVAASLIALTLAGTACTTRPASPSATRTDDPPAAAQPLDARPAPRPDTAACDATSPATGAGGSAAVARACDPVRPSAGLPRAARAAVTISLNATDVPGLGRIVTDQYGRTLYRFDRDSADPPTSTCDARCTATHPPVLADGDLVVTGLDRDLVGTAPRVDGDRQLTLNGWPLYRYADDAEGDTRGASPAWHPITPDGT